jgi:hypothetical protein
MKDALPGQQLTEPTDFLDGIQAFLDEIQRPELKYVLQRWIDRVRWVLNSIGDSFHKSTPL